MNVLHFLIRITSREVVETHTHTYVCDSLYISKASGKYKYIYWGDTEGPRHVFLNEMKL